MSMPNPEHPLRANEDSMIRPAKEKDKTDFLYNADQMSRFLERWIKTRLILFNKMTNLHFFKTVEVKIE